MEGLSGLAARGITLWGFSHPRVLTNIMGADDTRPMRLLLITFLSLAALGVARDVAWSDAKTSSAKPSDTMIISIAQQFVLEHYKRQPARHFGIAFDIANIHATDDPEYFAVVGGFMADSGAKQYKPHAFGIAMRLICAEHDKIKCWRMEKLVIDKIIILNN